MVTTSFNLKNHLIHGPNLTDQQDQADNQRKQGQDPDPEIRHLPQR